MMGNEERSAAPLVLALFGPLDVRLAGRPLPPLRSQKGQWLLALLALQSDRAVARSWLAGTLWPDSSERQAAFNLSRNLTDLRHALGPEARRLEAPTSRTLRLDLVGAEADVLVFDEAVACGDASSLERAVALHRGPLLQGCNEEWVFQERQAREEAYLAALEKLAAAAFARGDLGVAEQHLRRAVAVNPLREAAQRALIQVLATGGNYAAVLQTYRDLRLLLHRELNAEPDPETRALFEQIRRAARTQAVASPPAGRRPAVWVAGALPSAPDDPEWAADFSVLPRLAAFPHNLPLQLTRFIGREEQMAEIEQWLSEHRLVTLTGAGGCGKTRLALQVAAGLLGDRSRVPAPAGCPQGGRMTPGADGAWLVELASLADPALVPQAVAAALGVREEPNRPLTATLADHLRARSLLLVLDNCEHLLPACAGLAETLLQSCAHLRLLATSREELRIAGEATYRVPPLSLPDLERLPSAALLTQFEAVQLFVDRATAALPSFALAEQNAAAVAQVCHRLDGLPLAIELAAIWVKALPVEQINARLEDRFRLLTGGSRTALPRQQTLRATIDWSYNLLAEPERRLLRRLSVFAGGWTLAAAEAVCSDCGLRIADCGLGIDPSPIRNPQSAIRNEEVLDRLAGLVEKSLVVYEEGETEGRYRLLETIRQYAGERLAGVGEPERVGQRHRDFYLCLAEEAETHLYGVGQTAYRQRLESDHDNLREALEWSLTRDEGVEAALRLAGALSHFWVMGGHLREGGEWATRALARGRNASPLVLARALESGFSFAHWRGDYAAAAVLSAEHLRFAREARDRRQIILALFGVAIAAVYHRALEEAQACAEEGIALAQAERDHLLVGRHLVIFGLIAWMRDDYAASRTFFQETLEISRTLGDEWHIGMALAFLADVIRREGDCEGARALHQEGLPLTARLSDHRGIGWHLVGMAGVEVDQGRAGHAARLLGAASALLEALGSPLLPPQQREHNHTVERTEAALGEAAFAAAWEAGRAMPLEEAIRYALEAPESA